MTEILESIASDHERGTRFLYELAGQLLTLKGSDIFITAGSPVAFKINREIQRVGTQRLMQPQTNLLVRSIMTDRQAALFEQQHELNFSLNFPDVARFRVSAFTQRGSAGMVLRLIQQHIPTIEQLHLPVLLKKISLSKRGLVAFIGGTSSGKTSSLAAMVDYRNEHSHDHIVTIEDPIEFFHRHKECLVNQREVGVDTESYEMALKNTLRQAPNVVLIGECKDYETMQYALNFAETGHLCLTTIYANNTEQAFEKIMSFFPAAQRSRVLMDLAYNMQAFVSQRLIPDESGTAFLPVVEVLINNPAIANLIFQGRIKDIKSAMERSTEEGMVTFDNALFNLYEEERISYETAIRYADSANDLRLQIKLKSKRPQPEVEGDIFQMEEKEGQEDLPMGYQGWGGSSLPPSNANFSFVRRS